MVLPSVFLLSGLKNSSNCIQHTSSTWLAELLTFMGRCSGQPAFSFWFYRKSKPRFPYCWRSQTVMRSRALRTTVYTCVLLNVLYNWELWKTSRYGNLVTVPNSPLIFTFYTAIKIAITLRFFRSFLSHTLGLWNGLPSTVFPRAHFSHTLQKGLKIRFFCNSP